MMSPLYVLCWNEEPPQPKKNHVRTFRTSEELADYVVNNGLMYYWHDPIVVCHFATGEVRIGRPKIKHSLSVEPL